MKVTLQTIISDVRNISTSGSDPIDFRIEDSQIGYWADQMRATLISQAIQKKNDISDIWLQTIPCLSLIQVDPSECCITDTQCKVLRTELQLPNTVEANSDNFIIRVEDSMGNIISKGANFESKYNNYNKYVSNKPRWMINNNYVYIINSDFLSTINVIGIWDSPTDLTAFTTCDGTMCFSNTDQYPCSIKMAEQITDMVLKKKVFTYIQLPQDTSNDNSNRPDNPVPNIK